MGLRCLKNMKTNEQNKIEQRKASWSAFQPREVWCEHHGGSSVTKVCGMSNVRISFGNFRLMEDVTHFDYFLS